MYGTIARNLVVKIRAEHKLHKQKELRLMRLKHLKATFLVFIKDRFIQNDLTQLK